MKSLTMNEGSGEVTYDDKIRKIGFPVVSCIVLAVLYSKASSGSASTPTLAVTKHDICDKDECFYLKIDLVKRMNKSVDPCQDFYTYACGGWQKMNVLENNETELTPIKILRDSNARVIKKALENAALNYTTNKAIMKTVRVYNSCMNTDAIDARGIVPLTNLIREFGGWSVSGNYNNNVSVLTRMGKAARNLNVDSFLGVIAERDIYNTTKVVFKLTPAVLGMSYDYYTSKNAGKTQVRESYKAYMKSIGRMLGGVGAETKMMRIFNFELKLAKIASGKTPDDELRESLLCNRRSQESILDRCIEKQSLNGLCSSTGFNCSFLKGFLNILFQRNFNGCEKLSLDFEVPYILKLNTLYNLYTDKTVIADYIMWRVVNHYIVALPSNVTMLKDKFLFSKYGSPPASRWKHCIDLMMTPFDMPLGLLFVDAQFNDDAKTTVEEMTDLVRRAFIKKLPSQSWMDSDTQGKAKEKALSINVDIGYPAFIKDPVKLAAKYQTLTTSDNYFENYRATNNYIKLKNVNTYGKPVDKVEWFHSPAVVNARYYPKQNRIFVLAGIIQSPFYKPKYPRYLKYGAIGTVIGHEITHGFDSNGLKFDKYGNLDNWSSTTNFDSKAQCLVRQYNKYEVFGKHIIGSRTINENIADNGGIKIAYEAYQLWTKKYGQEKILPGLGLSPEQLFFVGFAQSRCSIYTKKAALQQLTDTHSINEFRVLGTLSNYNKFSEAFKCPSGSAMNPSNKCSVW